MNRMEEYRLLMEQLEASQEGLDRTLDRARNRRKVRNRRIARSFGGVVSCFLIFVLLVNFCTPVAYACSLVPGLRELAEAVTFSRSLTDAVDHEYVQPISLSETQNGITASVDYLIVDQKQVNVFYRLDSEEYAHMDATPRVRAADGSGLSHSVVSNYFGTESGALRSFTIDFVDEDVPDSLSLRLCVRTFGSPVATEVLAPDNSSDDMFDDVYEEPAYTAEFEFLLEFDPEFTRSGKLYPIGQTIDIDGQKITLTELEVYPTHLRLNIGEEESNTAWIKDLEFYIETDFGMRFDTVTNGISATGSEDSESMVSYRADSTWFYKANRLKIVITGAELLRKDMEKVYVDLETGETGELPEGVEFHSAVRRNGGWLVEFRAEARRENYFHQLFSSHFYDEAGERYEINSRSSFLDDLEETGEKQHFIEQFPLKKYTDSEVWLCPIFSHVWTAENEIVVTVQ